MQRHVHGCRSAKRLRREGFEARKVGLYPDRPNVLATLPDSSGGRSLWFNSHMDIALLKPA
jgi:acetylornithine deacetylase/succinyl-diaminopimelate desuccinylase-like protein